MRADMKMNMNMKMEMNPKTHKNLTSSKKKINKTQLSYTRGGVFFMFIRMI
jgi:hypothetical protein